MQRDPRRHVLILIPTLQGGGAERVIVTLLQHMDRARFRFTLAVVDARGDVFRHELPDDVGFVDLGARRVRHALPSIFRLIWRHKPQVVLTTIGHMNLALALLRILLPREIRFIAREATIVSQQIEGSASPALARWAYRYTYARFDQIVCQSYYMQQDLIDHFGVRQEKTVVINNPVDVERIRVLAAQAQPDPERSRYSGGLALVAVGRLSPEKGPELLIQAIALCGRSQVHLTLVGDGPMRKQLEQQVDRLGLRERVTFTGFQSNPYTWIAAADALVLSSRYEGFPNVVLEALACRKPVIATPAPGGLMEIVARVPGCVLATEISARALSRAIGDFDQGTLIAADAVAPYSVGSICRRYEALLL